MSGPITKPIEAPATSGRPMTDRPRVSIAIPLFNEEAVIPELLRRVTAVMDRLPGGPHELVVVDDGSRDGTFECLSAAAELDPRIVVVGLSRNFGHQAALTAALDYVSGDVVMVMDADLQDPPELVDRFLDEHRKGADVVYAIRAGRRESWFRRTCYYVFYRVLALISDRHMPLDSGDFGLMSRKVVEAMKSMREHHRYLRGLRWWSGFRQSGIVVQRSERFAGDTKYSVFRMFALALDAIFSFSVVPLRTAAICGAAAIVTALAYVVYAVYVRVALNQSPQGFTAIIVVMVFLAGVQLLFLGVIGEYLGRVYEATKNRPLYIVNKVVRR
jgi:polyisoprenyl-phosphate glycosyltransferase